jgi:hypothetical protein
MRVDLPSLRTDRVVGNTAPTLLVQLRVGTLLQAVTVVDAAGRLYLDIGNTRYAARLASSDSGLPRNGEQLQLKVLRESPVLAFEAVRLNASNAASNPTVDALRRFMPRQDSAAPLAANLALLASNASAADLPAAVLQAANRLWRAMPEAETLVRPQQLRQAVTDSGAFLEAKLAGAPTPSGNATLANDLKALLLQFAREVADAGGRANAASPSTAPAPLPTLSGGLQPLPQSTPSLAALPDAEQHLHELARQAEGAVARLTTVQVANSAPDPNAQALLVELPVRFEDGVSMLRLRIERDSAGDAQTPEAPPSSVWTVEAALDLGAAGALHARITLQGQRLDVQLRATAPEVVTALRSQSEQLTALLRESGLDVQRIACLHGLPPAETATSTPRLLDLHA